MQKDITNFLSTLIGLLFLNAIGAGPTHTGQRNEVDADTKRMQIGSG